MATKTKKENPHTNRSLKSVFLEVTTHIPGEKPETDTIQWSQLTREGRKIFQDLYEISTGQRGKGGL